MKKIYALAFMLILSVSVFAQEEEDKFDMSVSLNSDIFFGFYPFFAGSYGSGPVDFTFYGILWSGGDSRPAGNFGNWTEFGLGLGFEAGDALYINPQLGFLNGTLTSGAPAPVLFEGLVPNLTVGLDTDALEGEFYFGYYAGLDHGAPTANFIHYWINAGYKLSPFLSLGLHFEQLDYAGGNEAGDDAGYSFYQSVGPYIQLSDPKGGAFARFTTGGDLRSDEAVAKSGWQQSSFYKLAVGYSF